MLIRFQLFLLSGYAQLSWDGHRLNSDCSISQTNFQRNRTRTWACDELPCNCRLVMQLAISCQRAGSPTQASTQTTWNMVDAQQHTIKALRRTNMRSEVRIDSDRDSACPLSSSPSW